ncbi:unnamed protein product [Caenorhabditis brenneri]
MGLKLLILLALLCDFGVSKEHENHRSRKFFEKKHCGEIHPDKETACIFNYDKVLRSTIGFFPTHCSVVCADLFIGKECDLTEEELTLTFKNMKRLIGGLTVSGTNYTSAKFLAGLESIDTGSEQNILFEDNSEMIEIGLTNLTSIITDGWLISSSPKMKTLNLPNLKYTTPAESEYTHVELWIEKMGPSFCITFDEMEQFLNIRKVDLTNIAANYCEPTPEDNICTKPAKGCTRILGDVEIGPDSDLNAMKSVEAVFGTLTIKNTSIESFNFLESLKYVAPLGTGSGSKRFPALHGKKAVIIMNNPYLSNYTFPSLKKIRSEALHQIVFENNRYMTPEQCIRMEDSLYMSRGPTVDGNTCVLLKVQSLKLVEQSQMIFLVASIVICLMLLLGIGTGIFARWCIRNDNEYQQFDKY